MSGQSTEPELSVVVAAWNDAASLCACLASLSRYLDDAETEVIVASNFGAAEADAVRQSFPNVAYIWRPESTTVPELRAAGLAVTRGRVVALIEDHCALDENWRDEIVKAHEQQSHASIGGAVENASRDGLLSWAVYFYDYGRYMLPCREGIVPALSGLNVSYKRSALDGVKDSFRDGFFETFVNERLKRQGHLLYLRPSAVVYHRKSYRMGHALTQSYHLARSFGARRVVGFTLPRRAVFAIAALLLPILLPMRIVLTVASKGRHLRKLLLSLPHLVTLMASWSLGEFCGYLAGEGTSGASWR